MRYYPLHLDLRSLHCLVVGAGKVGFRKIQGLLPCQPLSITIVDPNPPAAQWETLLARHKFITYEQRFFTEEELHGQGLVFACTSSRTTNERIARACAKDDILCNVADNPLQGNIILPATITRGDLSISVSTNGTSPALARVIRQDLELRYGPEYEAFSRLLAAIRPVLLALEWPSDANRVVFRALATSALPELIKKKDQVACRKLLQTLLPVDIHPHIGEWCDDCFQTI